MNPQQHSKDEKRYELDKNAVGALMIGSFIFIAGWLPLDPVLCDQFAGAHRRFRLFVQRFPRDPRVLLPRWYCYPARCVVARMVVQQKVKTKSTWRVRLLRAFVSSCSFCFLRQSAEVQLTISTSRRQRGDSGMTGVRTNHVNQWTGRLFLNQALSNIIDVLGKCRHSSSKSSLKSGQSTNRTSLRLLSAFRALGVIHSRTVGYMEIRQVAGRG